MKAILFLFLLLLPAMSFSQSMQFSSADADSIDQANAKIIEKDGDFISQATVSEKDSTLHIQGRLGPGFRDYRIFGYERPDSHSKRMILISIFTKDVENNPFHCPFGAYYDTYALKRDQNMRLKYLSTEDQYIEAGIFKDHQKLKTVYIARKWVESYIDPTGTYKWKYTDDSPDGYPGYIQVRALDRETILLNLYVNKGAPSYNSGSAFDTLDYYHHQAVFHTPYDSTCQITFRFTGKGVYVNERTDDYNFGCGFGHGVVTGGYFEKISAASPKFKNYSTGREMDFQP